MNDQIDTNTKLDELMAVEVMGWKLDKSGVAWCDDFMKVIYFKPDWHPADNYPDSLNQAIICAEKWQGGDPQNRRVELIKSLTGWECNLYTFSSKNYWTLILDAYGQELSIAVCEAIARIYKK